MCLYPRLVRNPKYTSTKKNGGIIPPINDIRVTVIPIKCGNCMECMKQEGKKWQIRMMEEIKTNKNGKFITLTFSNENIRELMEQKATKNWRSLAGLEGYVLDNELATRAVRLWLENWRKKYKTSVRHWMITELGHNGTENIHLHGIVWTDKTFQDIRNSWRYGYIYPRYEWEEKKAYVNDKTVNYIIKYITKADKDHRYYKAKILTSAGIGREYINTMNGMKNKYKEGGETKETYTTRTGHQIAMPSYWRNKIYSDEEREKLWLEKLNKQVRYVNGKKIDISKSEELYYKILEQERRKNKELGYGELDTDWERKEYEKQRRILMYKERTRENK